MINQLTNRLIATARAKRLNRELDRAWSEEDEGLIAQLETELQEIYELHPYLLPTL